MVGEKLGSFRIEGTLGVGAMGVVYRATHETKGVVAAVKVINSEAAQRGKGQERFQREAEILKQFRHPNIVRFYAVGKSKGTWYIAMEFIRGQTLEQLLKDRGPLPWQEVADLGAQLCEALQYAHEHQVIHRDLKPSNLMVTDAGKVKLTDFGIAKDLDATTALTATGRTLGTAAYMAPEQIRGTPEISHKTDLYALGVVLYQLLTGQLPFDGTSPVVMMHSHLNAPVPRPSGKVAEIPKALDDLICQLMAKAPADRPWDAAAAAVVLTELRDKAARGEAVRMVWPTQTAVGGYPAAASAAAATPGEAPRKKKSGKKKSTFGSSWGSWAGGDDADVTRRRLETAGLVLALVAMSGFLAYMLWPPSAAYLYQKAEALMASESRADWARALTEYIQPLETRFPNHPYKAKTRAWHDKIDLAEVEGRARTLASAVNTEFNRPKTQNEERFVVHNTEATAAQKTGDDRAAAATWDEMARQLNQDDKEDRRWFLLATKRAEEVRKAIEQRREIVVALMERANKARQEGRPNDAQALLEEVVNQYGRYSDVRELLGLGAGQTPPGATPPSAPAQPTPASPVPPSGDSPGRP